MATDNRLWHTTNKHIQKTTMKIRFVLSALLCMLITSCSDTAEHGETSSNAIISVFFSPNGLGDRGYNDNIARGVNRSHEARGFRLNRVSPPDFDVAEVYLQAWLASLDDETPRLLVFASEDYEPLVRRYAHQLPDDEINRVMLFESRATDLPAYTFYMPFYGICYQAGYLAPLLEAVQSVAVICANDYAQPIIDGATAFSEGYNDNQGWGIDYYCLSDSDEGYARADTLYQMAYKLDECYDLIFPLAGGSVQGLLRYNRENDGSFFTVGSDIDMSSYSTRVPYSVVKHIDKAVELAINHWLDRREPVRHQRLGLASGLTELVMSASVSRELGSIESEIRTRAIEKEEAYENAK